MASFYLSLARQYHSHGDAFLIGPCPGWASVHVAKQQINMLRRKVLKNLEGGHLIGSQQHKQPQAWSWKVNGSFFRPLYTPSSLAMFLLPNIYLGKTITSPKSSSSAWILGCAGWDFSWVGLKIGQTIAVVIIACRISIFPFLKLSSPDLQT